MQQLIDRGLGSDWWLSNWPSKEFSSFFPKFNLKGGFEAKSLLFWIQTQGQCLHMTVDHSVLQLCFVDQTTVCMLNLLHQSNSGKPHVKIRLAFSERKKKTSKWWVTGWSLGLLREGSARQLIYSYWPNYTLILKSVVCYNRLRVSPFSRRSISSYLPFISYRFSEGFNLKSTL